MEEKYVFKYTELEMKNGKQGKKPKKNKKIAESKEHQRRVKIKQETECKKVSPIKRKTNIQQQTSLEQSEKCNYTSKFKADLCPKIQIPNISHEEIFDDERSLVKHGQEITPKHDCSVSLLSDKLNQHGFNYSEVFTHPNRIEMI